MADRNRQSAAEPERRPEVGLGQGERERNPGGARTYGETARRRPAIRRVPRWVFLFCALAALRVFVYSAAFPFFNNVDEQAHFDLVMKYGQGHVPRSLDPTSEPAARYIVRYGSPEYFNKREDFPQQRVPPPLWKLPEHAQPDLTPGLAAWKSRFNHEAAQPPLYYLVAGLWADVGSWLGFKGLWFLYWIRFLNVFLVAALVWVAYLVASTIFPQNRIIVLGVPLLAAVLPQDTYYSIQSDVLSPLCFGLAFYHLVIFLRSDIPHPRRGILAGLTLAATVLVKTSNLPLLVVVFLVVALKMQRLSQAHKLGAAAVALVEFALCALVPVMVWFVWNLSVYGDLTASNDKIWMLGWTVKPLWGWIHHPIFTPRGAWIFWSQLMASFWRGEFVWFTKRLAMPAADVFYWSSSLLLLTVAISTCGIPGQPSVVAQISNLLYRRFSIGRLADNPQTLEKGSDQPNAIPPYSRFQIGPGEQRAIWFAFWSFVSLVVFMGLLSVSFDFGQCMYPSREHPYFVSGRLVNAALIPFLLLYTLGLGRLCSWMKAERWQFGMLITLAAFVTISEILVSLPAFHSQYNLLHL